MNSRFENFISSANENKATFDSSIESVRSSLNAMTASASTPAVQSASTTGWLKGSLSYPWVLVCSLVPSLKELF
ncbi:hypothetical protein [Fibrobacter sp.]|uniref:hypothetical protein n=1 Tax=Fibrobacter sp. TaxID=35828 RepID=UPI003865AD3B